jgi:copper resistance protein D
MEALGATSTRFGLYASALLPLAFGMVFLRQLLEFRDPFVPWTEDAVLLLRGTDWGRTYILAAVLALLAPLAFATSRVWRGPGWAVASVLVLALGTFPALTGHANAGEGWIRATTLSADVLHVWAAGAWVGGLAGILFLEWTVDGSGRGGGSVLPSLVPAFSPVAVGGVATLVITGILAAWVHLPGLSALVDGAYGRTLLIKLGAVGAVMGLGWLNWRRHTPRLGQTSGPGTLRRAAALELAIAQIVLLVTAVLVRTPPSG